MEHEDFDLYLKQIENTIQEVFETEDYEEILDYWQEVLDVKYILSSKREYEGVILTLAWGGPSVYLDTTKGILELYWWDNYAKRELSPSVITKIDLFWKEIYGC